MGVWVSRKITSITYITFHISPTGEDPQCSMTIFLNQMLNIIFGKRVPLKYQNEKP